MQGKRKSGRPRKAEHEKADYQRIAVYKSDYNRLMEKIEGEPVQLVDAFTKMVDRYPAPAKSKKDNTPPTE